MTLHVVTSRPQQRSHACKDKASGADRSTYVCVRFSCLDEAMQVRTVDHESNTECNVEHNCSARVRSQ